MLKKTNNLINSYSRLPFSIFIQFYFYKVIRHLIKMLFLKHEVGDAENVIAEYLRHLTLLNGVCRDWGPTSMTASIPAGFLVISRRLPSSDLLVLAQVWLEMQYQPVVDFLTRHGIGRSDQLRIIDAGGNVGYTTLYFKMIFPNSRIIVLEPEDSNFEILKRNVEINGLSNVMLLKAGLWKNEAYLEVHKDFRDGKEWSYYVKDVAVPTDLKGYGVVDLLLKYKWKTADILKIDIEGGEKYLFADPATARKFLSMVKFIAMEIHDEISNRNEIYRTLNESNFEYFDTGELTIGRNMGLL